MLKQPLRDNDLGHLNLIDRPYLKILSSSGPAGLAMKSVANGLGQSQTAYEVGELMQLQPHRVHGEGDRLDWSK